MSKNNKGFTLIELIIVVAIIALLAAATFVAINPAKRVGDANDAKRWQDITSIADAFMAYAVDHSGSYVTTTDGSTALSTTNIDWIIQADTPNISPSYIGVTCPGTTNLSVAGRVINLGGLITAGYIGTMPGDPVTSGADTASTATNTRYWMHVYATGKLEVGACNKYGSAYPRVIR
ncbi:MAG: prepilin-type N-terminal cleavage/methylation domain-containing protein [Patescibacteria group bacterium]